MCSIFICQLIANPIYPSKFTAYRLTKTIRNSVTDTKFDDFLLDQCKLLLRTQTLNKLYNKLMSDLYRNIYIESPASCVLLTV